jgi:hypothetical protein
MSYHPMYVRYHFDFSSNDTSAPVATSTDDYYWLRSGEIDRVSGIKYRVISVDVTLYDTGERDIDVTGLQLTKAGNIDRRRTWALPVKLSDTDEVPFVDKAIELEGSWSLRNTS